jgi:plastocyanin
MSKKSLIAIGIIVIVIFGGFLVWQTIKHSHQNTSPKSSTAKRAPLPKEATVTLGKNGFSPAQVTIRVGSAVRWKNESGAQQTVNSDNYPTNQLHKELNFGVFANGSSVVYTFTKPGIYGYHNQFHHEQEGKVIVQ